MIFPRSAECWTFCAQREALNLCECPVLALVCSCSLASCMAAMQCMHEASTDHSALSWPCMVGMAPCHSQYLLVVADLEPGHAH
eukprot:364246-Chlamydomonas_euryale.AAC.7